MDDGVNTSLASEETDLFVDLWQAQPCVCVVVVVVVAAAAAADAAAVLFDLFSPENRL